MKKFALMAVLAMGLGLTACGSDDEDKKTPANPTWTKPAGYVTVNFGPVIDNTPGNAYTTGTLAWKGSMKYNSTTNVVEKDGTWGGPFAPLYDDGPWTTGGHEPEGQTAGDHKWSVAVFVKPPATAQEVTDGKGSFEYGLIDSQYDQAPPVGFGNGWIWPTANGTFNVALNATADVNAPGATLTWGDRDLKLVIDKNAIAQRPSPSPAWDTSKVQVKSSAWAWGNVEVKDDGLNGDDTASDGKYTFVLSANSGTGKTLYRTGLLKTGGEAQFVFVLGAGSGTEYKIGGVPSTSGVTAFVKPPSGSFAAVTVANKADGDKNTYVSIP